MSLNNNIRLATKEDFKRLKEIGMNCYDKTVDPKNQNVIARLLFLRYFSKYKFKQRQKAKVLIYCLERDHLITGFYELEQGGCLSSLYVHCDFQKQGDGKALITHALGKAKEINLKEIYLDASEFAHDFYQHFGFKDTKKPTVVLGVWMVPMKIKIV